MIDINELRLLVQDFKLVGSPMFLQTTQMNELLDRLEAAEKERDNANAAAVGIALQMEKLQAEHDALRARIEQMEKQEPIGWITEDYQTDKSATTYNYETAERWRNKGWPVSNLYALPGAQAAPSLASGDVSLISEGKTQPAPKAVAYLDLGTGGYMDIGTDLTDEALAALPKGRHMLGIVGTYGVDGYVPAQPAPSVPEGVSFIDTSSLEGVVSTEIVHSYPPPSGWLRAVDEALVVTHLGVANAGDTYEQAKAKLDSLIGFHVDVATDPAVNGGWKLVTIEPTEEMYNAGANHCDGYWSTAQAVWDAMLAVAPEYRA